MAEIPVPAATDQHDESQRQVPDLDKAVTESDNENVQSQTLTKTPPIEIAANATVQILGTSQDRKEMRAVDDTKFHVNVEPLAISPASLPKIETAPKIATGVNNEAAAETVERDKPKQLSISLDDASPVTQAPASGNHSNGMAEQLMRGHCTLHALPALPKKVVRIFVSSTFTDTKEERNALMQHVYPRLADFCREKHGLEFQIVDMRWGVPEQASDNHSTSDLCIQEIHKCQQVSVGPNFVAILGNKYGYRPIPSTIDEHVYSILSQEAVSLDMQVAWSTVQDWYLRDDNALPPCYVLQPISSKIPNYNSEMQELRRVATEEWNKTNKILTDALRKTSEAAHSKNKLTDKQKQTFFMSVTESEITAGILEGNVQPENTTFCIIRNISDIRQHLHEPKAPKFTDISQTQGLDKEAIGYLQSLKDGKLIGALPQSNLTKVEIDWSSSGANISLEEVKDIDVVRYAQRMLKGRDMHVYKHKEYLDSVCHNFFKNMSRMIQQGSAHQEEMYDDLTTEVLQHWHLAKLRCEVFEGREEILAKASAYLESSTSSGPLVIYGNSGCGKTSVIAKIMENLSQMDMTGSTQSRQKTVGASTRVIISRFLGTTTNTCNIHQLLVSLCRQLSLIHGQAWREPDDVRELTKLFHSLLKMSTSDQPVVLILDSIDQMLPTYNAYKLNWLPAVVPNHVKIIASTIEEGYPILQQFREKYSTETLTTIEVTPLGETLGMQVIQRWLTKANRTFTTQQRDVITSALGRCSLPLYARIAFDHIVKWKSYDTPSLDQLETTVKGAINKLFESMEDKFGKTVVKHCLAYLTASRNGLSEAELEHMLSMDDVLLNTVFKLWNPPIRRIPPLIWTRIRSEINNYIVERSADDVLVLYWYHRQFIQSTKQRYLEETTFQKHIHEHLVDFFSGAWNGKEKPFTYTDAQVKRFGLDNARSAADRKLPAQPYQTKVQQHGATHARYNKRKLSELPFHLVKCKNYAGVKTMVFFNYEWLYNKIKSSSVQQMLEEFEVFMQSDKLIKKDVEMKILFVNLQLKRPDLLRFPESLSYELQGTLSKYIGKYESITGLIKQCDCMGIKDCPLVPISSCFQSADLGFTQNIHYRRTEPRQLGGTFTCTNDFKTLYIIDYDKNGKPTLIIWDMTSGEKATQMPITKTGTGAEPNTTAIYWQIECVLSAKHVIAFYQIKLDDTYQGELRKGSGYVDVINVENGEITETFDCFMYRDDFLSPLIYLTNNNMCIVNGWKRPLINLSTNHVQSLNRASFLSNDERFFILCGKDKTLVSEHESRELVGEFDLPESQAAVTASSDFTVIAMLSSESKDISIFDMSNKQMKTKKRYYQLFKPKHVFKLDVRSKDLIATAWKSITHTNEKGLREEVTNNHVLMKISPDKRHLLVIFIGWKWTAFMWCLNIGKFAAKFVGNITAGIMEVENKLPQFSFDGSAVVYNTTKRDLIVIDCDTGNCINQYSMQEDIKDYRTCPTESKVAVMLQKSVIILNIAKTDINTQNKSRRPSHIVDQWPDVLLEREISWDTIHREVVCRQTMDDLDLEEVADLAEAADTDRIASARSKRQHALAKYITPDGLKTVHYHSRVQVIDTKSDEVKYSPRKGDTVLRAKTENGISVNETVHIPGLDAASRFTSMDLLQGDRIVNENNKIKFRVNKEPSGQFQIMTVPSVLTVYTTEELELRKIQRIDVYKESVLTVSNNYIVTAKHTQFGHFVNVYSQRNGKAVATHRSPTVLDSASFSFSEMELYTVDRGLNVRLYLGPNFSSIEQQVTLETAKDLSSAFVVKSIVVFPEDKNCVLVQYGPEGSHALVQSRYVHVNIITKEQSAEMLVASCFQDLSPDGALAIDSLLHIYDLPKGVILRKIAYSRSKDAATSSIGGNTNLVRHGALVDDQASPICARISRDKKYVVFVDTQDTSIHLVKLEGKAARRIVSCHSHAADVINGALSMRHFGRVVQIKTKTNTLRFAIADFNQKSLTYTSEQTRAKVLVTNIAESCSKNEEVKPAAGARSVYQRKTLMLNQIGASAASGEQRNSRTSQPVILVLGEPILCSNIFKEDSFSITIATEKMTCQDADEALEKLRNIVYYDAIVLQLVTNDVVKYDVDTCVRKVEAVVRTAQKNTKLVVISEAPCRSDSKDLNEKTLQVNDKLEKLYHSGDQGTTLVRICKNGNLSNGDKPNPKYFQDSVNLSRQGLMRLLSNLKRVLAPHLNMHHI